MADWAFAQRHLAEELALVHVFSIKKQQDDGEVEFRIEVKEFAERNNLQMKFLAQADKAVNQDVAPFIPFGWGPTLLDALSECLKGVRQYRHVPGGPAPK